ncbi:two-partner secretion domain-containing protein [Calothrix sp. NIES-2100]|uniref:two-partner secretion domain-containing protein n=1 Tax=Calothrix sp. NIES-2100 TaxID=1954172 RepID=UPI0030DCADFB
MRFTGIFRWFLVNSLTCLTLTTFNSARAQIAPDNTLGRENSVVTPDTIKGIPSDRIDGGAIRGANLFHSFSEFNIDSGRGAYFTNPSRIENILTRVTGNNASQILGTLGVLGNANLFLINPNGIIFGKDAVLDIRGSFTATTADGMRFGENGLFSATNPQSSNLLTVKPGALFSNALSNQQATINNQGNLTVDAGKNINLFSANVINTGTLTAPEGTVQLTGTENLITRGNIATATLFLNTKNLTIGENNNATVDKTTLEGLSGNTNLILQGTNDITVDALTNNTLNLANGSGKIAFIADDDRDGNGNFQMDTADTIKTNGRDISISGASLTLGNIDTYLMKGGDIFTVDVDAGGDIPASGTEGTAIFTFTVSESQAIEDLDLQFSASHTWDSDIAVDLTSPSGKTLELFNRIGNDGDNFQDTVLDDSADTSINNASPPFQGRFKPTGVGGLASFNGENTTGIWQLTVTDCCAGDSGILYKAGETAPWGTAEGTKLMFRTPVISGHSGAITLNATNGSINVDTISTNANGNNGGSIYINAKGDITANRIESYTNNSIDTNGGDIQLFSGGNVLINFGLRSNSEQVINGNAGNITIKAENDISINPTNQYLGYGAVNASTSFYRGDKNTGNAGNIQLTSIKGNINVNSGIYTNSWNYSANGNTGNGGEISLTSLGNITTSELNTTTDAFSGNAGDGGAISLTSTQGNITTQSLNSSSYSESGNAGDGGAIALTTTTGDITIDSIESDTSNGNGTNGGDIQLLSGENVLINFGLRSNSEQVINGNAGNITIKAENDISINPTNQYLGYGAVNASTSFNRSDDNIGNAGRVQITSINGNIKVNSGIYTNSWNSSANGNTGNGGAITLTSLGNITTGELNTTTDAFSGNAGDGGAISLTSTQGNITTQNFNSSSYSQSGNAGDGGGISLSARGNISSENLDSSSASDSGNAGSGGAISLTTTGGDITANQIGSYVINSFNTSGGDIQLFSGGNVFINLGLWSDTYNVTNGNAGNIIIKAVSDIIINPNSQDPGFGTINASTFANAIDNHIGNAGKVQITSINGNIGVYGGIYTNSTNYSASGNTGNGGAISLTSLGNIRTGELHTTTDASSGNADSGGAISLTSTQGNITTQSLNSSSYSESGNAGDGGAIALTSTTGDITIDSIESDTSHGNGTNGGDIQLFSGGNVFINFRLRSNSEQVINGNGGNIIIKAASDITINPTNQDSGYGAVNASTFLNRINDNTGNAGKIEFTSSNGNIKVNSGIFTNSTNYSSTGNTGNGGAINLTSLGNITTQEINSISDALSGNGGFGGAISLTSTRGNISTQDLNSLSYSVSGNAGTGGMITLSARDGNINGNLDENMISATLNSFSVARTGNSGEGGNVSLTAKNNIINLDILTLSSTGKSGDVQVNGSGDLSLINTDIITSKKVTIKNPRYNWEDITYIPLDISGVGQSGNVDITSTGNLTFKDSRIESDTRGRDNAGNVNIFSPGTVTFNNSKIASNTNSIGRAGNIQINANNLTLTDSSEISASTTAEGKAGDITLNTPTVTLANGGKIFATTTGNGNGGTITVNAPNEVNLGIGVQDFAPILSVETSGAGKAGNIIVNTPSLTISDTARITATATNTATNTQEGGSISLNASKMNLAGIVGVFAETQGQAPAGRLTLQPYENHPDLNLTLFPNSKISASTSGSGNGGDLIVKAPETINISGQGTLAVETSSNGNAGNIEITTQNLNLTDGVTLSAATSGIGNAGDIVLNTPTLNLTNGSKIFATTSGSGDGGTISVNALNSVNIGKGVQDFAPILSVETTGAGKAGDIIVNTPSLTVSDTARITATATATATNTEGGGSITLNASKLDLAGIVGIFAETQGQAPAGTLKLNPYANQPNLDITLFPNSNISASTSGSGKGGDLILTAPENINIAGKGKLAVESTGIGDAGNILITTQNLNINDGVKISASTMNGQGGNININAHTLTANNGAQFLTNTSGTAKAGNINVQVRDNITLDGTNTGLFANTEKAATGDSGNITIDPEIFTIKNGAGIGVNNNGSGKGGNIFLSAGTLTLDNQAFINAATASNTGGEITLDIKDFLFLRHNSNITASAGTDFAGGDGGNITINSPFIIAVNQENSDITANAYRGNGGNVNISTQGIFGIGFQTQDTQNSGITASSEFGISGNVIINTPEVDPSKGLVQLPSNVADASGKIDNSCNPGSKQQSSSFTITGRGGVATNPFDSLQADSIVKRWVIVDDDKNMTNHTSNINKVSNHPPEAIVEAQGLLRGENGEMYLVAQAPEVTPHSPTLTPVACSSK